MSRLSNDRTNVDADHLILSRTLAAIYGRVSTVRQEEEGTIETQLSVLREFAHRHGHAIVKEYIDDGWSGDILARPALDALRQDVKARIWQAVLIYDPDRLARRYSYQELVMDELRDAGIEVIFMTVPAPKNSEEKILHGVRGLFAEYERAKIAERFRLGKLRKVKEGHVLASQAPYGYRYVPKQGGKHGYYEIDTNEARVVKMIFKWVAEEGLGIRQVIRRLHESGIRPRACKRGVWSTSTISNLLRNPAYIGEARWGATRAVVPEKPRSKDIYRKIKKSSRRWRPREEWFSIPVPAIVEKELFAQARRRLDFNFANARRNTKNEYLLAGKMRCVCGRTRTGEGPKGGRYLYYRCTDKVSRFPLPPACKERGVNARIADQLVWQELVKLMSSPARLRQQIEKWEMERVTQTTNRSHELTKVRREVAKLKEQETRYNKAYGAGLFSVEQLREYTEPIKTRLIALDRQHLELASERPQPTAAVTPSRDEILCFSDQSRTMLHDLQFTEKRSIVLNIIEKIVATPLQLRVYGYIPIIDHVEMRSIHRYSLDTNRYFRFSSIQFELPIALPPPLRRGMDYGFGVTSHEKTSANDNERPLAA